MPRFSSMDEVPDHIKEKLAKFFTNVGGRTFAITGLPPELTGGALARYSRAPTGMQLTLVNEFLDENGNPSQQKGTELMDRVLNEFGDDSVAELEGAHIGIEGISQLLTKTIEDRRIGGSPIEQSTRYVRYDQKDSEGKWRYLRPSELRETDFMGRFEAVNDRAFEVYSEAVKRLQPLFEGRLPKEKFAIEVVRSGEKVKLTEKQLETDGERKAHRVAYNFAIRCAALDMGRCVLPSSTLTHMGIYGNGRFFTHLLNSLKSGELDEERERGYELEKELQKVIPTFIKRNSFDVKKQKRRKELGGLAKHLFVLCRPETDKVTLIRQPLNYQVNVLAYSLFPYTHLSLQQITNLMNDFPRDKLDSIWDVVVGKRDNRRDRSDRGLEAGYPLMFDLVGGFAEYRDLQRHRMVTQQRQRLTPDLGFIMPGEIGEVGLDKEVEDVEAQIRALNSDLRGAGYEAAAQYATLFNHRIRFAMGMNLREFQHLSELRTQPSGHPSYRSMLMEMADKVGRQYSWAPKAYGFIDRSDPDNKISRAQEQGRIAGKNLAKGINSEIDL